MDESRAAGEAGDINDHEQLHQFANQDFDISSAAGDLQIDGDDRLLASGHASGNDVASMNPSLHMLRLAH